MERVLMEIYSWFSFEVWVCLSIVQYLFIGSYIIGETEDAYKN